MDKKKIRKSLSGAHKVIKPLTDRLSHKDIKHVHDGMQKINTALTKANPKAPQLFAKHEHLSKDGQKYYILSMGVKQPVTTKKAMTIIEDAKKFIKENY